MLRRSRTDAMNKKRVNLVLGIAEPPAATYAIRWPTSAAGQRFWNALASSLPIVRRLFLILLSLSLFLLVWTLIVLAGVFPTVLLPSPAAVFAAGMSMMDDGTLLNDIRVSLSRATIGFTIGAATAVVFGAITGRSRIASGLLEPTLRVLAPIPAIALVPLAVLWFGIGEGSRLFLISFGVFFPVWINTHAGISSTPDDYLRVCACLGASRWQRLFSVILPEALPDIAAGLRVGGAVSFILIVASEMTGTDAGIGFRLEQAHLFSQADRLIFCLIVLGLLGALIDQTINRATAPLTRWAKAAG